MARLFQRFEEIHEHILKPVLEREFVYVEALPRLAGGIRTTDLLGGIGKEVAIEGLSKLRTGALMLIAVTLIIWIASIAWDSISIVAFMVFDALVGRISYLVLGLLGLIADPASVPTAVLLGPIIMLIAFFAFIVPGTSRLAYWSREFSLPSKLIKIGLIGGLMVVLIAVLAPTTGVGGEVLMVVADIVTFVGYIGIILLSFKLGKVFGGSTFIIAGVLFIADIFIGMLAFIAWILMFVGLGSAINKLKAKDREMALALPIKIST